MLVQHYPIIGSSTRICWQVTMCARVDTGKENIILLYLWSLMKRIICHVYHSEYTWTEIFCWYKLILRLWARISEDLGVIEVTNLIWFDLIWFDKSFADSPDLSNSVTEFAYSMLKSISIIIEEEDILVYISGYICRKVSRSACHQCKVILMPIINCIHFCLRSNIWIFKVWGFCSTSKVNTINWFKWTNFRKYTWTDCT